jgi:hypothetical protein
MATTLTHRLKLYFGHNVAPLAGLGGVLLRWPLFGSKVLLEVCTLCTHILSALMPPAQVQEEAIGTRFVHER